MGILFEELLENQVHYVILKCRLLLLFMCAAPVHYAETELKIVFFCCH